MRYITNRWKRRFVHRNDPPDPMGKVACGAFTYKASTGSPYRAAWELEAIDPADLQQFHKCMKCFPPGDKQ